MCACSGSNGNNTGTCSLTASDYQGYLNNYQCVKNQNAYLTVGIDEATTNVQITLLEAAIVVKTANPVSCQYASYEGKWQSDTTKILVNLTC